MSEEYIDEQVALDDREGTEQEAIENSMVAFFMEQFVRAEDSRRIDEERWLRSYRNYRGIYGPDVQFTETEKSRVFV